MSPVTIEGLCSKVGERGGSSWKGRFDEQASCECSDRRACLFVLGAERDFRACSDVNGAVYVLWVKEKPAYESFTKGSQKPKRHKAQEKIELDSQAAKGTARCHSRSRTSKS